MRTQLLPVNNRGPLLQEQKIHAIIYGVFVNIPWNQINEVIPEPEKQLTLQAKAFLEKQSLKGYTIDFDSNIWDLSSIKQYKSSKSGLFNFELLPTFLIKAVKLFVLFDLSKTKNLSTCKTNYSYLSTTLIEYFQDNVEPLQKHFIISQVIGVIHNRNNAHRTNAAKAILFKRFLLFLDAIYKRNHIKGLYDELEQYIKEERQLGLRAAKLRKYPSIPEELVAKIERTAIIVMRDNREEFNPRMAACCLLIQIWLGLRPIELTLLQRTDFFTEQSHGLPISYIKYRSPKNHMKSFPIYCFPIAVEAISTAIQLINKTNLNHNNELMMELKNGVLIPFTSKSLSRLLESFYIQYLSDEIMHSWDGISPHITSDYRHTIYTPSLYQYRVHLCTYLYNKGISRGWIEQNMSHLDSLSFGYYYRQEDELQKKDRESVTKFIENVINNDITPIGKIAEQLISDIGSASISVESDIESVIKKLGKKYRLRTLPCGICAKAAISKCQGETEYEKLLCAYGDCSNIIYSLYDLPDAILRYENLKKTYQANKDNGRTNAATKELFIINRLTSNRLSPEIAQLEKEICKEGYARIMSKYPEIGKLRIDINQLKNEFILWKKMMNK